MKIAGVPLYLAGCLRTSLMREVVIVLPVKIIFSMFDCKRIHNERYCRLASGRYANSCC